MGAVGTPGGDPFLVAGQPFGYNTVTGKTVRSPLLNAGERTLGWLAGGQSHNANVIPTRHTPANASKCDQINIWDGGCYALDDPLLGPDSSDGNLYTYANDAVITAGIADRMIYVPFGVSATTVSRWRHGGDLNPRITLAVRRARAAGIPRSLGSWQIGESDNDLNTWGTTYRQAMREMIETFWEANDDTVFPIFLAKSTYYSIAKPICRPIRDAIDELVDGVTIFAGPDIDTLTGLTYRQPADSPHLNDTGAAAAGTLWATAIDAAF